MFGVAMARRGDKAGPIPTTDMPRPGVVLCGSAQSRLTGIRVLQQVPVTLCCRRSSAGRFGVMLPVSHMPDKAVYLLVVEGFADWEPAHAVAELRRHGHYRVESVGLTAAPVHSMGGLTVLPSKIVSE